MELTPELINAVLEALRPNFNAEGLIHLDLAVSRFNVQQLAGNLQKTQEELSTVKAELLGKQIDELPPKNGSEPPAVVKEQLESAAAAPVDEG